MPMNNRDAFIFQLYCGSQKPEYPKKTRQTCSYTPHNCLKIELIILSSDTDCIGRCESN
jgi:hypothetical protein